MTDFGASLGVRGRSTVRVKWGAISFHSRVRVSPDAPYPGAPMAKTDMSCARVR